MNEASLAPLKPQQKFSLAHLALLVPWVALVIGAWGTITDNSFLWHVRAGDLQQQATRVLVSDPFSFTVHGERWLTQSWLIELFYALGERIWALGFVSPMILTASALTFVGIALVSFRFSASIPATAFALVLSTLTMISFLVPRPVLFSYLLFVVVILAWDRPATRWTLPFLFWIWASIHASFAIGLAYVGLTIIMERDWKAFSFVVMAGLATLGTAHGLGIAEVLYRFFEVRSDLALISEWRRPELLSPQFLPFLGGLVFVVIGSFRGLITPRFLWLLVPFLLLGLGSVRGIPPAWLGILPVVALSLSDLSIGLRRGFGIPAAIVFVAAVLIIPIVVRGEGELSLEHFPVDAAERLTDEPTFHDDRVGGYLIWAEGPERLVYLDDRVELYGERIGEYVRIRDGVQDWRPVFRRDGIEQVLLAVAEPLTEDLVEGGWDVVFKDEAYVVLRP